MEDYYDILQCSPQDSTDTIKHNYQQLVLKLHPDKQQQQGVKDSAAGTSKYHLVQRAWQVLSDDALRKEYNARRTQRARPRP